jgi:hypothetical protein
MVSMITEIPVLVVPITVLPVPLIETLVPLVLVSELMLQLVNVHPVIMTQVKLNVNYVNLNVLLVILTMFVSLVTTHLTELHQVVNVQPDGKILTTELIVLKNHMLMD